MSILLDTHIIIWLVCEPEKLSQITLNALEDKTNKVYYSMASIWEISIKSSIGRISLNLNELIENLQDNDIQPLDIKHGHILKLQSLLMLHKDPFDRILVAQAMTENWKLFTRDDLLLQYSKKHVKLV